MSPMRPYCAQMAATLISMHKLKIIGVSLSLLLLVIVFVLFLQPSDIDVENKTSSASNYQSIPDFASYQDVNEKKRAFFNYLKPVVVEQNLVVLRQRAFVHAMRALYVAGEPISNEQKTKLENLIETYRVDVKQEQSAIFSELLLKVDIIPVELVLVQTANESGWGTSRFAVQGYNFFGLWCFKQGCGFVPKYRNEGATHEVAKFENINDAMQDYMINLNRHHAYQDLRLIRQSLRTNMQPVTATALIDGLHKYSERGEEYMEELHRMIRVNKDLMKDET